MATSHTRTVRRKTRIISKLPCPKCGEDVPVSQDECYFCGHEVNFNKMAREFEQRNAQKFQEYREKLKAKERKGSVGVGIIIGLLSLIILSASLSAIFAVDAEEVTITMIIMGGVSGIAGLGFAIHNVFSAFSSKAA